MIHGFVKETQLCVSFAICGDKTEHSNTAKLSVYKSVFVPIFTYGHESWAMTKMVLCQVQAAEMEFQEEFTV